MLSQIPTDEYGYKFSDDFVDEGLRALEIPEYLLQDVLNGQVLEIRGEGKEETILVSDKKTYLVRQALFTNCEYVCDHNVDLRPNKKPRTEEPLSQLSQHFKPNVKIVSRSADNSLLKCELILDESLPLHPVYTTLTCHYEVKDHAPKLFLLKQLLTPSIYTDEADEEMIDEESLVTLDDIREIVQASDEQILRELCVLHAVELNGHYRLLDEQYWWVVADEIFSYLLQNDIPLDKVEKDKILENIKYPKVVVSHLLDYFSKNNDDKNNNDDNICSFDEEKLCQFRAGQILSKEKDLSKKAFWEAWLDVLPVGCVPKEDYLLGHAILIKGFTVERWERFEEDQLPYDPKERFGVLFAKRQKWAERDIRPYLKTLIRCGYGGDRMLISHTRILRERIKGVEMKFFKPRHIKYSSK